jgi:hypothetical protein
MIPLLTRILDCDVCVAFSFNTSFRIIICFLTRFPVSRGKIRIHGIRED